MIDYYEILELNEFSTLEDIKKNYKKLAKKYHPDKNNSFNAGEQFILIKEAYDILSDNHRRKIYDYQRRFYFLKDYDFIESEIDYLNSLYENINNSYEIRFCKILFNTMPENIKQYFYNLKKDIFNENKDNSKEIIVPPKYIDIKNLNCDYTINLNISFKDYYDNILKKIIIHTKDFICYLFIRDFKNIHIKHGDYLFNINFIINNNKFIKKNNDLVFIKNINIYELLFKKSYEIYLPNSNTIKVKKEKSNVYIYKGLGLVSNNLYNKRGDFYVVFNLDHSKDYSQYENEIKKIFDYL